MERSFCCFFAPFVFLFLFCAFSSSLLAVCFFLCFLLYFLLFGGFGFVAGVSAVFPNAERVFERGRQQRAIKNMHAWARRPARGPGWLAASALDVAGWLPCLD